MQILTILSFFKLSTNYFPQLHNILSAKIRATGLQATRSANSTWQIRINPLHTFFPAAANSICHPFPVTISAQNGSKISLVFFVLQVPVKFVDRYIDARFRNWWSQITHERRMFFSLAQEFRTELFMCLHFGARCQFHFHCRIKLLQLKCAIRQ